MMRGGDSNHAASADVLAMASLASRQDLAPRVRELLAGVLGLFWHNLERSLATTLDEFERHLVQQANKPRVGAVGERCLDSVRRIKPTRADLVPRFMLSLEDDLSRFDRRSAPAAPAKKTELSFDAGAELSLVGSSELDESLTLREMAQKVEARQSVPLFELGYRFGVLAARSAFDGEMLPLGPARITSALRYAVAGLDLPLDHRILFYQIFERFTMTGIGALYVAANAYLAEQGILKYLQLQSLAKSRAPAPAPAPAAEPRPAPRPRPGSSDIDVAGFGLAAFEMAGRRSATAPPGQAPEARPTQRVADASEDKQFVLLRTLIDARRNALGQHPPPRTADAFEPRERELQAALAVLQVRSPPTMMIGGKVVQRTIAQLRQDLLNQLRQVTPSGQTPRLADQDADTIDIVGLLFEHLMAATRANGRTQALLTRLQVPMLRAALRDKRFFFKPDHPARRLLGVIADGGTQWLDDGAAEADAPLIERMQRAIERINSEYDTDVRVFDQIAEELHSYSLSLARKAEVAERRLAEASRGREKLALARDAASRAIAARLAKAPVGRLLRTLLEQAWTDVLALTILRQGEKSDLYQRQLALAEQMIMTGGRTTMPPQGREEIEAGLTQVGYHDEEIDAIMGRLFTTELAPDDAALSQTDLAIRLKSKMRLGEGSEDSQPGIAPKPASLTLNAVETQMLERLKAQPFGTPFEIVGGQADGGRVRLSWFSPLTGRCLLTNQRGARVDERGLEQVARDLVAGKLRFADATREPLVERCWKATVDELERGERATAAVPAN